MIGNERRYLAAKVPDLSPAAWDLLFKLVTSGVSLDVSGQTCGPCENAERTFLGLALVHYGLAFITNDMLYASEDGMDVVAALECAYHSAEFRSTR